MDELKSGDEEEVLEYKNVIKKWRELLQHLSSR